MRHPPKGRGVAAGLTRTALLLVGLLAAGLLVPLPLAANDCEIVPDEYGLLQLKCDKPEGPASQVGIGDCPLAKDKTGRYSLTCAPETLALKDGEAPVIPAPTRKDVFRAVRERVQEIYPKRGCSQGFGSNMRPMPHIQVCVNFQNFENVTCDLLNKRTAECTFQMEVVGGSGTHGAAINPMLNANRQYYQLRREIFLRGPASWVWSASDPEVNFYVPADWRDYFPHGRPGEQG